MGINLAKAKENIKSRESKEFKPITPGRYNMEVEAAELTTLNDKEAIEVTFRIVEGDFRNRKIWHRLFLTEDALTYVVLFLQATGNEALADSDDMAEDKICSAVIGSTVSAYVKNKNYKGKVYSNVESFQKSGEESESKAAPASTSAKPAAQTGSKKSSLFK
jgi:hypothetical protein